MIELFKDYRSIVGIELFYSKLMLKFKSTT